MRIGVLTFETRSDFRHVKAGHVREVKVQKDDVVIIDLAEVDAFFAQIGGV